MRSLIAILTILCFTLTLMQPVYAQQDADIETIFKEGKEAYLNGEYNKAVEKLSVAVRFLRVKDDLVDANITLALAYLATGDTGNCQNHIKEALKIAPDISLSTDEYSPKFIELVDTSKKNNIIQVIFRITPAATLYLNGFKVQEGDMIEIPVLRGENSIKVVKQGYGTVEQDMMLNDSGAVKEIKLAESDLPKNGVIEKPGIKKKKKFPWLLVIGGALVLGAIIYFLILKKPKFTLKATVGEGVSGSPASSSASYNKNETVTYNYQLEPGYTNLTVKLNGQDVNASGIIKMDKNHTLEAKSGGLVGTQHTLLVIKEKGVDGYPATDYYSYNEGERINYSYAVQSGYKDLLVKLDGKEVANSGSITMDSDHTLHASAVPTSGQTTLTVSRGNGVSGSPASGSYAYQVGDRVNYSYTLKDGYTDLVVKLDGVAVSASGTITMDRNHTLNATASTSGDQVVLSVDKGVGVSGTPNSGNHNHNKGANVPYNYSLQTGYTDLVVKLDGITVSASGNITMDRNHTLNATATAPSDQVVLSVDRGEGVSGTPNSGNHSHNRGANVHYNYSLESGYSDLVVKLDGSTVSASGNIAMDASHNLTASATSTPTTGNINVTSSPAGAAIWLDGSDTGFATPYVLIGISPGSHTILLIKKNRKPATGQVTVIAGQTVDFHKDLEKE